MSIWGHNPPHCNHDVILITSLISYLKSTHNIRRAMLTFVNKLQNDSQHQNTLQPS